VHDPIAPGLHVLDESRDETPQGVPGRIYFETAPRFAYRRDDGQLSSMRSPQGYWTVGDVGTSTPTGTCTSRIGPPS